MEKLGSKTTIATILVFGLTFLASCHPRHSRHWHGPSGYRSPEKRVAWLKEEISDRLVEFHQMLRPEQRAKLVAEIEKHRKKWERHHRHW
ncbi:MAG: hypothetical protein PVI06_10600 [Desulfobacterales bacterium]